MTTAVLSADQVVTVRCRVCAKPLLQSALVAHIENCRRIHPSHPLYEALNAADPITETVAAPVAPPQPAFPQFAHNNLAKERDKKEKRDRKRKRDKADAATPSAEGISPMVGLTSGSSSVAGTPALLQQNNGIPAGTQPLTLPTAPAATTIQPLVPPILPKEPKVKGSRTPKDPSGASSKDSKSKPEKSAKSATIDYDKQCGVITDDGNPCTRSITCKMHLMHMKRSVQGRSQPFDTLVAEYQLKMRAAAPLAPAGPGGAGEHRRPSAFVGPMSEDEARVLLDVMRFHKPVPLVATGNGMRRFGYGANGGVQTLGGLLAALQARSVRGVLKDIGDKRRAVLSSVSVAAASSEPQAPIIPLSSLNAAAIASMGFGGMGMPPSLANGQQSYHTGFGAMLQRVGSKDEDAAIKEDFVI